MSTAFQSVERLAAWLPKDQPFPAPGLTPCGTPQPLLASLERNRLLVTAFRSPATAKPFGSPIPGSKFLAYYFATLTYSFRGPFGFLAPPLSLVRPKPGWLPCRKPVVASTAGFLNRSPSLHSPSGFLPPSGSKRSPGWLSSGLPSESARSPFAPRRPQLFD